jgi:hypothetical protein
MRYKVSNSDFTSRRPAGSGLGGGDGERFCGEVDRLGEDSMWSENYGYYFWLVGLLSGGDWEGFCYGLSVGLVVISTTSSNDEWLTLHTSTLALSAALSIYNKEHVNSPTASTGVAMARPFLLK